MNIARKDSNLIYNFTGVRLNPYRITWNLVQDLINVMDEELLKINFDPNLYIELEEAIEADNIHTIVTTIRDIIIKIINR